MTVTVPDTPPKVDHGGPILDPHPPPIVHRKPVYGVPDQPKMVNRKPRTRIVTEPTPPAHWQQPFITLRLKYILSTAIVATIAVVLGISLWRAPHPNAQACTFLGSIEISPDRFTAFVHRMWISRQSIWFTGPGLRIKPSC